jgi:hypothetical protein
VKKEKVRAIEDTLITAATSGKLPGKVRIMLLIIICYSFYQSFNLFIPPSLLQIHMFSHFINACNVQQVTDEQLIALLAQSEGGDASAPGAAKKTVIVQRRKYGMDDEDDDDDSDLL